jgi:biotin operon repressor
MKRTTKTSSTVDARRKFGALVAAGALKACERHVAGAYDAEERIAEGVAMTWAWYVKQIALGREPQLALVRHCCRMRTVDRTHRLDSGDHTHWQQDVFYQQGRNGVELRRLVLLECEDDRVEEDPNLGLAAPGCADPSDHMNSALDLEAWLGQLSAQERQLLALRQAGYGLEVIGRRLKCTSSTTWKNLQDLGRELADRAGITIEKRRRRSRVLRGLPPAVRDAIAAE